MALLEINRHPSARELRWFGMLLAVSVALAGGLVYWRLEAPAAARLIWTAGAALAAVYAVAAPFRRWIWLGWLYAAFPIGWTLSHVALAATYYLVLTPIGLLLRLVHGNPLDRAPDRRREQVAFVGVHLDEPILKSMAFPPNRAARSLALSPPSAAVTRSNVSSYGAAIRATGQSLPQISRSMSNASSTVSTAGWMVAVVGAEGHSVSSPETLTRRCS